MKSCFCNTSHTKCLISKPQKSRFRPRDHEKRDLETSMQNTHTHTCTGPLANQKEFPKRSTEIQTWIPRSPFLFSQVPLERSMVSQGAKWRQQACRMTRFAHKKLKTSALQITTNCETRDTKINPHTNEQTQMFADTLGRLSTKKEPK